MDLSKYYAGICQFPNISKDEEAALFETYYSPDSSEAEKENARSKIINSNLRFVFKQAKMFSKRQPDQFEELILAGNEGLLVGFNKFNPQSGYRFLSYAGWWVNQRILLAMSQVRVVSVPIWKQQLATRIEHIKEQDDRITFDQIKSMFPLVAEKDLREMFETRYLTYYLGDMNDNDFPIDPIRENVEVNVDNSKLHEALNQLPEPHQSIIKAKFGLDQDDEESTSEIQERLGITKEVYRKAYKEGISILRDKFNVDLD